MNLPFRSSYFSAILICVVIIIWVLTGKIIIAANPDNHDKGPATAAIKAGEAPIAVRIKAVTAREYRQYLEIRGRTESKTKIAVRAETSGLLLKQHVAEGAHVQKGDILCSLDEGTREASILKSKAAVAKAKLDFVAAEKLTNKGYAAKNQVAAMKANLDAEHANLAEAEIDLKRTQIYAPAAGIIIEPFAEMGEMLSIGDLCATVAIINPMLVIGQVSERDVGRLTKGMLATARLVTGETVEGLITFIASSANAQTRTFKVEIAIANPEGAIREGVTARAMIQLPAQKAHWLDSATIVLDDQGRVGIRAVDPNNMVVFFPVRILSNKDDGLWVMGLPDHIRLIVVGQDYVSAGQFIVPVSDGQVLSDQKASKKSKGE